MNSSEPRDYLKKNIPDRGALGAKALSLPGPRVLEDQQGGQCGWSRAEGRAGRNEVGQVIGDGLGRQMTQGLVGHCKDFGFCCVWDERPWVVRAKE